MYFTAPAVVSELFVISITAQLGIGSNASNWKVDMFKAVAGGEGWVRVGDLTGGEQS